MKTGPKAIRPAAATVLIEGQECVSVPLTKGMFALIDKADSERVLKHAWIAKRHGNPPHELWYAVRGTRKGEEVYGATEIKLHVFLLGPGLPIDHRNSNGLDNRRSNIRRGTQSQNQGNSRCRLDSTFGLKGVTWVKPRGNRRGYWTARLGKKHIGTFQSLDLAILARNSEAVARWGDFARLTTQQPQP